MKTKRITTISIFAAVSYVLSFFSFPLLPFISFLKLDFSDIPVLIGTFYLGPASGGAIAFLRSFMHYLLTGGELGFPIGDTAAFLASISFVIPFFFVYNLNREKNKVFLQAAIVGTLCLTMVLTILNWFVLVPAYIYVLNFDVGPMNQYLLMGVIPFNLIKGTILSILFFLLFKPLRPFLLKRRKQV